MKKIRVLVYIRRIGLLYADQRWQWARGPNRCQHYATHQVLLSQQYLMSRIGHVSTGHQISKTAAQSKQLMKFPVHVRWQIDSWLNFCIYSIEIRHSWLVLAWLRAVVLGPLCCTAHIWISKKFAAHLSENGDNLFSLSARQAFQDVKEFREKVENFSTTFLTTFLLNYVIY